VKRLAAWFHRLWSRVSGLNRWDVLFVGVLLATTLSFVVFLGQDDGNVITSRELLRLTSTPHILNEAPDAAGRGKPLRGSELLRDSQQLQAAKHKVYAGIYVANNFSLDLEVPSFSSKGYIWMRWQKPFQEYLEARQVGVEEVINLENDINPEVSEITPLSDVQEYEDGTFGQGLLYTGEFYIDNLNLKRFPFNSVSLPIALEVDDPVGDLTYRDLRLIPDLRDSGIGQYSDLFGWLTRGWSFAEFRHHFSSGLGFSAEDEEYSQLIFDVSYQRSSWSAFWTLVQPLFVVMASVILITRVLTEFRLEIPIAVLLTLIFLQDGYRSELPDLAYLTFLDSVYVIAYLVAMMSFALVIYLDGLKRKVDSLESAEQRHGLLAKIRRLEKAWPAMSLLVMVLLSTLSWALI
jgi:hypothetical protein